MSDIEIRPTGDNALLNETISDRKISWLERALGPENYRIVKGLVRTPASIIGIVLVTIFLLIAIFAPVIMPPVGRDAYKMPRDGFSAEPKAPGAEWKKNKPDIPFWYKPLTGKDTWVHLLRTTEGQYDILYGIIWGTRVAFVAGLFVVVCTVTIGVLVGSISAYYGGMVDNIIMRFVDIMMTLPFLLMVLILASVLASKPIGKTIWPMLIALIAFGWMGYARIIRGDILSVKERDFVLAARVVGVKNNRILFRHILPNAIFPTLVLASLAIGDVVLSFAGLSFLGVGTPVGFTDWGQILSFSRNWITNLSNYWYIIVYPGMTLVMFVMGWNLIGDAMRDVLDPRMRGKS